MCDQDLKVEEIPDKIEKSSSQQHKNMLACKIQDLPISSSLTKSDNPLQFRTLPQSPFSSDISKHHFSSPQATLTCTLEDNQLNTSTLHANSPFKDMSIATRNVDQLLQDDQDDDHRVIQTDPSGRFECWDICLGKGAYKEVYKAFDQEEGVEVAWNQLRADYLLKRDVQKIYGEVKLLQRLHHENIINFFHVWTAKGLDGRDRVFFITELMSSGTLKSFIRKTKGRLKPKVVKNLCRHILRGLAYLHSRDPPIIHRDLKCDNIFINGNNGVAKIGDLGLATIKHRELISSVLGTPEFMAPELYDEQYDEKVDIYAFGMCVLELVTKEYPYMECTNQAQIYKRVTAGIKPQALDRVADAETRTLIELCIDHDFRARPSADQLLCHPFFSLMEGGGSNVAIISMNLREDVVVEGSPLEYVGRPIDSLQNAADPIIPSNAVITQQSSALNSATSPDLVLPCASQPIFSTISSPNISGRRRSECQLSMQILSFDSADFTVTLSMTLVTPSASLVNEKSQQQDVKFPFHLLEDTVESVVAEMVREGLLHDLSASENAQIEGMMRHIVYGDQVAQLVLDHVNAVAPPNSNSLEEPRGPSPGDAQRINHWLEIMNCERERFGIVDSVKLSSPDPLSFSNSFDEDDISASSGSDNGQPDLPSANLPQEERGRSRMSTSSLFESPPIHAESSHFSHSSPATLTNKPIVTSNSVDPCARPCLSSNPSSAVAELLLDRGRSASAGDGGRSCPGEGAYISQYRRGTNSPSYPNTVEATPISSPVSTHATLDNKFNSRQATTIPSTYGKNAKPGNDPGGTSQPDLLKTLEELQSLALSGFDQDGKQSTSHLSNSTTPTRCNSISDRNISPTNITSHPKDPEPSIDPNRFVSPNA